MTSLAMFGITTPTMFDVNLRARRQQLLAELHFAIAVETANFARAVAGKIRYGDLHPPPFLLAVDLVQSLLFAPYHRVFGHRTTSSRICRRSNSRSLLPGTPELLLRFRRFELPQRIAPNLGGDARERDLSLQSAAIDEENLADFALFGKNFFALLERHGMLVSLVEGSEQMRISRGVNCRAPSA